MSSFFSGLAWQLCDEKSKIQQSAPIGALWKNRVLEEKNVRNVLSFRGQKYCVDDVDHTVAGYNICDDHL